MARQFSTAFTLQYFGLLIILKYQAVSGFRINRANDVTKDTNLSYEEEFLGGKWF